MATVNFGFGINKPRVIDLDRNNLRKSDEILREMPELQTCIGCGACTALCTAGNLTSFNFRKVHTLVRRGEYEGAYEEMNKCMLCGKCRLHRSHARLRCCLKESKWRRIHAKI